MSFWINKKLILVPLLLCSGFFSYAQMEKDVLKPVYLLFEGMENADTALISKAFDSSVRMITSYTNKEGKDVIHEGNYTDFLNAIANKKKDEPKWIEKLHNTQVKIDGNIAQVWANYSFFLDDKFSHCGVNAFQLAKFEGKWKIIHIMDTRRKKDCNDH